MKNYYVRLALFLVLNFAALGIGGFLMGESPGTSEWYNSMNQAPWTPPGIFFGIAWTVIMLCFSFYMAKLVEYPNKQLVYGLFAVQWILNVGWNYVFFNQHLVLFGLIWIATLAVLIAYFFVRFRQYLGNFAWLIVPYVLWLIIATSLNAYIWIYN